MTTGRINQVFLVAEDSCVTGQHTPWLGGLKLQQLPCLSGESVSAPPWSGARIPPATGQPLPMNEPILFQAVSILTQTCQDFRALEVRQVAVLDPVTKAFGRLAY